MKYRRFVPLTLSAFVAALVGIQAQAQTLLYFWNFNNSTGSGGTLATPPAFVATADGYTGGTFVVASNTAAGLATPASSGLSNAWSSAPADWALVNPTAYRSAAGVYQAPVGSLASISNSFTVALWFKLNASVTSFTALNGGGLNARLMDINTGSLQDGNELFFSLNSGNGIQVGVNSATSTGPTAPGQFGALGASPQTMTNNWIFVAITYTNTAGGTVNIYTGTTNSPAILATTLTAVGTLAWSATTNYILVGNRGAGDRGLPGAIDNLRIYKGAGDLQFITNIQSGDLPTVAAPVEVTWVGNVSTNWDLSTLNWTASAVATNYANGNLVLFNDMASAATVNLTTNVFPGSVTVSNNTLAYAISGIGGLNGSGGLTKLGSNALTLGGTNSYSGVTAINSGTLLVNGRITGSGSVSVNSTATLGGSGIIFSAVTVQSGGNFAPGAGGGVATLTISNNLTLASGSFTTMKVQTGSIEDQAVNSGTITYGGTLTVTNVGGALVAGDSFQLFTAANRAGNFAAINLPALGVNLIWINNLTNSGTVSVAAITVPVVTNLPATGVQGTYAALNGQVLSTGNQTPTVVLYYGPANGGTNAAAWSNSVVIGTQDGSFNSLITGLSVSTTYYFAALASNNAGGAWAIPAQSFTTQATDPANVPTLVQYLSGVDKDNTVPWNFQINVGRNSGIATNIPVPSCWELMGFGNHQYGSGSSSNAETGFYTHTFAVPPAWAGKKIFLVFEGAFTDTTATINGQSVGPTHQGGYYEFKYDVTSNVIAGATTNVLSVTVKKWSTSVNLVRAEMLGNDYWIFGGIYRPVYLEAKPAAYIDRVAAHPLANGQITVDAALGGIANNYTVRGYVTDPNNVQLGNAFSNSVAAGATNVTLSASLPSPNPWSAEFPNLYTLNVELLDANNVVIHSVTNTIGFRTITFTNSQGFFVNGKKVVMRGINRHEEWPTTGRTTSRALSILDIGMIKDANFNAIRLSHYPPNKVFLEECDRLGVYVLHEFASYQHGGDQGGNGPMDIPNGSRLIEEMIRRDVNHPCVFAWGNGNESGANPNLDGGAVGSTNYFALHDIQNRLVIRAQQGGQIFNNVVTDHYENYTSAGTSVSNYLRAGATSVYLSTEMIHGLYDGGSGACLAEMWELFRTAPNSGGLFLWVWNDAGILRTDTGLMDVSGSSGPDGIVGPFREKEASYYTVKSIFSPVQIDAPHPATFAGTLAISNRFDFTSLNQCTFNWQLGWFPDATDPASNFSSNALTGGLLIGTNSGNFAGPALPPGTTGSLALPSFPPGWTNYDALRVTATDPFGNNLYTWTWPLRSSAQVRDRIVGVASAGASAISAITNATDIIVTNGPRVFRFSKTTGIITSLTISNQALSFTNGPRPVAGSAWTVTTLTNYSDGSNYVIAMNDLNSSSNAFQWSIRPDGWVKLNYRYTLTGLQENIGITFDYPSNRVTGMNWLGQGPFRVWKNRSAGQEVFTHTKPINNTWTGQRSGYSGWTGTQWAYPEFAGFHGQLYWATVQTTEQPITIATSMSNLFFRVLSPPATDVANVNPRLPPGAISLLHGISAIGAKFDPAANIGPSAATNVATGLYTGEASFYFGALPASGADRDGNNLVDVWELSYFNALGQNPSADPDGDGLSLLLENAFDLSPLVADAGSLRLPRLVPGTVAPAALAYRVPQVQLNYFSFIPGLSEDLSQWFWADAFPNYFIIGSTPIGAELNYVVQPNLTNWIGNTNHLFLRLQINKKN